MARVAKTPGEADAEEDGRGESAPQHHIRITCGARGQKIEKRDFFAFWGWAGHRRCALITAEGAGDAGEDTLGVEVVREAGRPRWGAVHSVDLTRLHMRIDGAVSGGGDPQLRIRSATLGELAVRSRGRRGRTRWRIAILRQTGNRGAGRAMLLLRIGPGRSNSQSGGHKRTDTGPVRPWRAGTQPLHAGTCRPRCTRVRRPAALPRVQIGMAVGTTTSSTSGTCPISNRDRGRCRREAAEDVRRPTVLDNSWLGTPAAEPERVLKHWCMQHVRGHIASPRAPRNGIVPPEYPGLL